MRNGYGMICRKTLSSGRIVFAAAICLLVCSSVTILYAGALDQMTDKVAREMRRQVGVSGVYFEPRAFRNSLTGEIPILSILLSNQLQASMSRAGFSLAETMTGADYLIACDIQPSGSRVDFFFKYYRADDPERFQSIRESLRVRDLPPDALSENLDTKALKISTLLLDNPAAFRRFASDGKHLRIFINPVVESRYKYQSDFSEDFLNKVRSRLIQTDMIRIVEPRPAELRTRSLLRQKAAQTKNLNAMDAVQADAEAVLDGTYYIGGDEVVVSLRIRNTDGTVIGSAEERIPRKLISLRLDNPAAEQTAQIADAPGQGDGEAVVRITTDKGGAFQTYYEGETVLFMIQTARPLYVNVYNINEKKEVEFLYPDENSDGLLQPGAVYTIPPDDADWAIVVHPPFGLENVVVFACEQRLPLPKLSPDVRSVSFDGNTRTRIRQEQRMELSRRERIHPLDLVEYYRGVASVRNVRLYETGMMITTRGR